MIQKKQTMRMRKHGLSDVVATVLIVLLALAAVAIIWSFIRPSLERSGTAVQTQSTCLEVEVEVKSCRLTGGTPAGPTGVVQLIKAPSSGVTDIKVIYIVTANDGSTTRTNPTTFGGTTLPTVGTTLTFPTFTLPTSPGPYRATAAAVVSIAGGQAGTQTVLCESPQTPVNCA